MHDSPHSADSLQVVAAEKAAIWSTPVLSTAAPASKLLVAMSVLRRVGCERVRGLRSVAALELQHPLPEVDSRHCKLQRGVESVLGTVDAEEAAVAGADTRQRRATGRDSVPTTLLRRMYVTRNAP